MQLTMKWINLYLKKSEPLGLTILTLSMVLLKLGDLWSPRLKVQDLHSVTQRLGESRKYLLKYQWMSL